MNQKQIGIILIIIGLIIASIVYTVKLREDKNISIIIAKQAGSCYLEDGTCLHDRSLLPFIAGWILSASLLILGIYLAIFDKTQSLLAKQHLEVSSALKAAKIQDKQKDEFKAFLSGFTEEEQKVLQAIQEQEGIKQATLRYRVGMSKASLSLLLKSLAERNIVNKKPAGKTNQLYLIRKF